jgi:hypothetical protein
MVLGLRPLSLHHSALTHHEYDFFTDLLLNYTSCHDLEKSLDWEKARVGVRDLKRWLAVYYRDVKERYIDAVSPV